ncbi:hypothetical protein WJX79_006345 [Trebouxia sp. C0005]
MRPFILACQQRADRTSKLLSVIKWAGGLDMVGGVLKVVGEVLGVADVDELEAGGVASGLTTLDDLNGQEMVECVLELLGL